MRNEVNPYSRISDVAAKLGVGPVEHGKPATITVMGRDGKAYDLWEVIVALIDKMDKVANEARP